MKQKTKKTAIHLVYTVYLKNFLTFICFRFTTNSLIKHSSPLYYYKSTKRVSKCFICCIRYLRVIFTRGTEQIFRNVSGKYTFFYCTTIVKLMKLL